MSHWQHMFAVDSDFCRDSGNKCSACVTMKISIALELRIWSKEVGGLVRDSGRNAQLWDQKVQIHKKLQKHRKVCRSVQNHKVYQWYAACMGYGWMIMDDDESVMQWGGDWSKVGATIPESQKTCALEHRLSCSHITSSVAVALSWLSVASSSSCWLPILGSKNWTKLDLKTLHFAHLKKF